jgi:phosphoesterase RecJ-like protein
MKDIVFTAMFTENKEEGIIKISFRSKGDFDVNKYAREHFSGGGHINAAGGKSTESLEATIQKFIATLAYTKIE